MKKLLFYLMLATSAVQALPLLTIHFPAARDSVVVDAKVAECSKVTKAAENYFTISCKAGSIPVMLIREFKYPATILSEIKGTNYEDIKKLGEKAIKKKIHPWGNEYWWETPSSGMSFRAYYCPKNKTHCYYMVHDGKTDVLVRSK